jgi:hypothetical protein
MRGIIFNFNIQLWVDLLWRKEHSTCIEKVQFYCNKTEECCNINMSPVLLQMEMLKYIEVRSCAKYSTPVWAGQQMLQHGFTVPIL